MSNYYEQSEQIVREYDARLMKRLLGYLRPYLGIFALSIVALLLATAGELITPILIQRGIDNHILPFHRALKAEAAPTEVIEALGDTGLVIDGAYFFPSSKLSNLSANDKSRLRQQGILLPENFFILRQTMEDPAARAVLKEHPDLFRVEGSIAVISEEDLGELSRRELRAVRREHYRGLGEVSHIFLMLLGGVLIFAFTQIYLQAYLGQLVMKDLRTDLYDHTIGLSLKFIDSNPVGRLVSRITNDVETINELFTTVLSSLFQDISLMIGVLAALFILSPRLALFTVLSMPPVLLVTLIFRKRAREAFRRVRRAVSAINSFLSEYISGMRIVQLFTKEKESLADFDRRNDRLLKANLGEMYVFAAFRPLIDLLATVSIGVIIYFGASFLLRDLISLGILVAFLNLIRKFYHPVRDLSEKYNILQSAMAGAERVFDLLDEKSKIPQPSHSAGLEQARGYIAFDDVSFWYKEGEIVLRDLSFQVSPGETVAIVGYTGAGKTTITSLLTRLWDVQKGAILLDGMNIKNIPTDTLRQRVQSVLQDVFLFSGTVEENIRLGRLIPEPEIQRAIRVVRADSFIAKLPRGLQTMLGERGSNLSMGQRQLLSFARVLAHDPDVLILDEATGTIDTETEKLIQEALKQLLRGRTSIVIAHRLSTIRNASRILVLHRGELVESGTHEELMLQKGMYHNLYQMQFLNDR